jgi:hypothetical protein
MPFWTLHKNSNTPAIYGSIAVMSKRVGIPANTLYNYFSRDNAHEFENENVRIVKTDIVRSLRSQNKA